MKNTFHRLIAGLIAGICASVRLAHPPICSHPLRPHELYDQRYSVGTASDEVNAGFR